MNITKLLSSKKFENLDQFERNKLFNTTYLTIGKTYEILYTRDGYFYMKDDTGQVRNYHISKFITNKEYRKRKLKKLKSCQTE